MGQPITDPAPRSLRLSSFEVGEAFVRPPWGVRRFGGGWDVHFYLLQGAPCRFLPDRLASIPLGKPSICLISDRRSHSFQDDLCSPIDQLALPAGLQDRPQIRVRNYGGASGAVTSSFYIGGRWERAGDVSAPDLPPVLVLEFDAAPTWLYAGVSLIKQEMGSQEMGIEAAGRLCEFLLTKSLQVHRERQASGRFPATHPDPPTDHRLRRVLEVIDQDIALDWTLSTLAEAGGLSRSRLTTRWLAEMGVSVFEYITSRRLERGAYLLAETDLDIAAIARRVGYRSHAAFSTAFKRIFERTPAQYRAARARGARRFTQARP